MVDEESKLEEIVNKDTSDTNNEDEQEESIKKEYKWFFKEPEEEVQKKKKAHQFIEEDPIGFYKIKSHMKNYKVQLFPKHLPYDHLKERRAFLFC